MPKDIDSICACGRRFDSSDELRTHLAKEHPAIVDALQVWGKEVYPRPDGEAFIDSDPMKCSGCGLCEEACSMHHFGIINKEWARIFVRNFLLPLPKAIPVTCCQCQDEERPCQQACPLTPPAISFDKKTLHMVVDRDACTGCLACQEACGTEAVRFVPEASEAPLVCDLCDRDNAGERNPRCVQICPTGALHFHNRVERIRPIRDSYRKSANAKADMIARRLYPLTRDSIAYPPWQAGTGKSREE
jgi:Fe-S-cluster-containing hydrogenase component 2